MLEPVETTTRLSVLLAVKAVGTVASVTVITTELVPAAVGVPEIAPVPELIDKPAGKPVADQT